MFQTNNVFRFYFKHTHLTKTSYFILLENVNSYVFVDDNDVDSDFRLLSCCGLDAFSTPVP